MGSSFSLVTCVSHVTVLCHMVNPIMSGTRGWAQPIALSRTWPQACVSPHRLSPFSYLSSAVQSQSSTEIINLTKNVWGLRRREQVHHGKTHAKVRLMRVREAQGRSRCTALLRQRQSPPYSKAMGTLTIFILQLGKGMTCTRSHIQKQWHAGQNS